MYYKYNGLEILETVTTPYEYIKDLNILLIRHGESVCNNLQTSFKIAGKSLTEDYKIEDFYINLTDVGKKQASQLGVSLKKYMQEANISCKDVLVLISPYIRTRETFEIANQFLNFNENSNNIIILNSLIEQFFGAFHMISKDVKKQLYEKVYSECNRNTVSYFKPTFLGESPFDVCNRLWNAIYFIKDYTKKNLIKNVFIFGHGNSNRCMLMNLLNLPPEFYDDFPKMGNSSIIQVKNGKYHEFHF